MTNISNERFTILVGNSRELVKDLPTIHSVMTSPPYFQKRVYGEGHAEIGQEDEVEVYVDSLVSVFNDIPLHPQGSLWVNLGDTRRNGDGLLMVPERFALAMLQSGWKLVDHVIWAKGVTNVDGSTNGQGMIEPTRSRLNGNGFEPLFRFVKCHCP